MKVLGKIVLTVGFVLMPALVAANPALLPKHPGYPSAGEFANDIGQHNLPIDQSLSLAAASEDMHIVQGFKSSNDVNAERLQESDMATTNPSDRELTIKHEAAPDRLPQTNSDGATIQ